LRAIVDTSCDQSSAREHAATNADFARGHQSTGLIFSVVADAIIASTSSVAIWRSRVGANNGGAPVSEVCIGLLSREGDRQGEKP
jgi:hypothetical protein